MEDIATLGLAIDSSQAKAANAELDKMEASGKKAEAGVKRTTSAFREMSGYIDALVGALRENTAANQANTLALTASTQAAIATEAAMRGLTDAEMLAASGAKSLTEAEKLVAAASNQAAAELKKAALAAKEKADASRQAAADAKAAAQAEKDAADAAAAALRAEEIAAAELAGTIDRLRNSVQPFAAAQERVNAELMEFRALAEAGEFSAEELAQAELVLGQRADMLAAKQAGVNKSLVESQKSLKLTTAEGLNMSRQFADIGVTAAMGMNPFMIAIQQGPQVLDALQQAAIRTGGSVKSVLFANLLPFLPLIAGITTAVATLAGGFALATRSINKDNGDIAKGLHLTERQMERVKDSGISTTVTLTDTFMATLEVVGEKLYKALGLSTVTKAWNDALDGMTKAGANALVYIVGSFLAGVHTIRDAWRMLPGAVADSVILSANKAIGIVEAMVNNIRSKFGMDSIEIGRITNVYQGEADKVSKIFQDNLKKDQDAVRAGLDEISDRAVKRREKLIKEEAGKGDKAKKPKKSEEEKEFERREKAAKEFLKSLREETAEIGLNTVQTKLAGIERAALEAPTKALAAAIREASAAWLAATNAEATRKFAEELSDLNEAEKFSISLQGMNARERATANAQETIRLKLLAMTRQGLTINTAAIEAETAAYIANATAKGQAELDAENASDFADEMGRVADRVYEAADAMGDFFGKAGEGFGGLAKAVANYGARVAAVNATLADAKKDGIDSPAYKRAQIQATEDLANAELDRNKAVLSSFKSMFKERSAGYKALEAVEKVYAAVRLANSIKSIAQDGIETASSIFNAGKRAVADGVSAVAKAIASMPFPLNIAAGAATIAALAAIGVSIAGGGGGKGKGYTGPTADSRQETQGTGTVLGDASSTSQSIARSLDIATRNSNKDLEYSNDMVRYLRNIDTNILGLTSALARQLSVSGAFDTSGLNIGENSKLGAIGSLVSKIPLIGGMLGGLFGGKTTTVSLNDQGLDFGSGSVGDIIANGIGGALYQEVLTTVKKKGILGIGSGTKTSLSTNTTAIDSQLSDQVGLLIGNLKNAIVSAAGTIGVEGAGALLDSFQVSIGKISVKDMSTDEINDALSAAFSKVGDEMVNAIYGDIREFQKAGEGALETIVRLGRQYQVIDVTLSSIGKTFDLVGTSSLAARQRLVDLAGGLDEFQEQAEFFRDNFLTEAEQMAPVIKAVNAEMSALGLSGVTTIEQFKGIVAGLDLSSESGAVLYSRLMAVAPAFKKVSDYATSMAEEMAAAAKKAAEEVTQGLVKTAAAADEEAKRTAGVVTAARQALTDAYKRERDAITSTIAKITSMVASLKAFRSELDTGELAGLSPENAYGSAKSEFDRIAKLAAGGDESALGQLEAAGRTLLEASKEYNATGGGYFDDLQTVKNALDQAIVGGGKSLDTATRQLEALDKQVASLIGINDNIISVNQGIANLALAEADNAAAIKAALEANAAVAANAAELAVKAQEQARIAQDNAKAVAESVAKQSADRQAEMMQQLIQTVQAANVQRAEVAAQSQEQAIELRETLDRGNRFVERAQN